MPLAFLGSMMFGGALLGSHLNQSAHRDSVRKSLSNSMICRNIYSYHPPLEYIRGEIFEAYSLFKDGLKDDSIVPDMFICYSELYSDAGFPESKIKFYKSDESDYEGRDIDRNSYYNWWEENYNKIKVRIYPEVKTKKQAEEIAREYHIESLKKLAKKDIYPIDKWNLACRKERKNTDCPEVQEIKKKTEYNPPEDDTRHNPMESEYFDYHFSHPVKTSLYISKDKNPLHKKQIRQIKNGIKYARTTTLKVWQDRFTFETQGALSPEYVIVDYFLRWCKRKKIEIYDQEIKAFFCALTPRDNPVNYAVEYIKEYNKMDIEEQYQHFCDNNYYLYTIGDKYGYSKEFDATYDYFEEGKPLPANANMNINIPYSGQPSEISLPKPEPVPNHQLVRSPESTTGYDFRPKQEPKSDFWHNLWIGTLLIGGALLFFLSIP